MTERWSALSKGEAGKIKTDRIYRVILSCDLYRQGLQMAIHATSTDRPDDIKEKIRKAFEVLLERIHLGI